MYLDRNLMKITKNVSTYLQVREDWEIKSWKKRKLLWNFFNSLSRDVSLQETTCFLCKRRYLIETEWIWSTWQ